MSQVSLTVAEFRALFPEFVDTTSPTDALVQQKLDEAWRRTPPDVWGEQARDGQSYLAAHLLAISPFGRAAVIVQKDGSSTYGAERARLEAELGPAVTPRVT